MRQTVFAIPGEIPKTTPEKLWRVKPYLEHVKTQGVPSGFGATGERVGLGVEWKTQMGRSEAGLRDVIKMVRYVWRACERAGIISPLAEMYLLESRLTFIRAGDPGATITLRED